MTFGHQTRDISIVITNGSLFDKAWLGIDPSCVGIPSLNDELNHSRSTEADHSVHSIFSSLEKLESSSHLPSNSINGSSTLNQSNRNISTNHTTSTSTTSNNNYNNNSNDLDQSSNISLHQNDMQIIDESSRLMKISASPMKSTSGSPLQTSNHNNSNNNNSNNNIGLKSDIMNSPSRSSPQLEVTQQAPSEEQLRIKTSSSGFEIRRRFEESIHEYISTTLGWKKTPQLFCWDEGENGAMPEKIDQWLSDRYKSLSQHVQVPNICSIIREQCLPELRLSSQKVVGLDKLLLKCKQTVKCLQLVELRHACQWLHLLGDIVILDTIELDSYEKDMWSFLRNNDFQTPNENNKNEDSTEIPSHDITSSSLTQHQQHQQQNQKNEIIITTNGNNSNNDNKLKTREGKRLKIQIDLELMKKQAPQRNCKIILNPEWFTKYILTGIVCKSDALTKNQSMLQPWCDNEYIFTHQQIYDYIFPHQTDLNMKIPELLISLEVQRIGVILSSISSFCLPCRMMGDKMKWLSDRQVTKMSLSQFNGFGSKQNNEFNSITSAIGRRIKAKHPCILPPSTFSCLQSHILHTWISEKDTTWKYHRVMLWERGIGITIEQPPIKSTINKHSPSSSSSESSKYSPQFLSEQVKNNVCKKQLGFK